MNYINLDFCIIENPLDKNKRPIIFVTRKGRQYLDETVINEDDYEKAIYIIQNIGYVESDILTFEFSQDPDFPHIDVGSIKKVLEEEGMNYSQELEETMKSEFELFNLNGAQQFIKNLVMVTLAKLGGVCYGDSDINTFMGNVRRYYQNKVEISIDQKINEIFGNQISKLDIKCPVTNL